MKHSWSIQTFHTCAEASPAEKVPLHDWDVNWFRIPLGAWQWKAEAPSAKWETPNKARFWTAMGHTFPKHGASMDLDRLRAPLAAPLTEVKYAESGKVDVLNIEVSGKMVKMLCAPYKDPQDPLKFLEALDTDMIILHVNLADGPNFVSPIVMAKLINNPETVLVIYGEVSPVWDALATLLEAPRIAENGYWYEKVQVCYWLPGAGKTGKGGIQVKPLVPVAGVKIKKKVCTTLLDCEASHAFDISLLLIADPTIHRLGSCERDEPGFMPLVLYTWLAMLMRSRDRSDNVMIFDRDVHTAAKVAALDDPSQVCSLQLTKQKRSDWARSYHHEVTHHV